MDKDEILLKLQDIFRDVFDQENLVISRSTSAADIEEWDSLNQIKIILRCEQLFRVPMNARKIATLDNVGGMVDYVKDVLDGANPRS